MNLLAPIATRQAQTHALTQVWAEATRILREAGLKVEVIDSAADAVRVKVSHNGAGLANLLVQNMDVPEIDIAISGRLSLYYSSSSADDFRRYLAQLAADLSLLTEHIKDAQVLTYRFLGVKQMQLSTPESDKFTILRRLTKKPLMALFTSPNNSGLA
jgi:hypothetical protein